MLFFTKLNTPIGDVILEATDEGLHSVQLEGKPNLCAAPKPNHPVLKRAVTQLKEYFEGKRTQFDLPLKPKGTPFQLAAWEQLRRIPYGKTICYSEQAKRLGDLKKTRAVGMANRRNPLAIVVPCHRVIGKSGALVGFGGPGAKGLQKKSYLLNLERSLS